MPNKKTITLKEFAELLKKRLKEDKDVNCCWEELMTLADIVADKMPSEKIEVNWQD